MGYSYALAPGDAEDAVDVALRVDDDRDLPVVGEVGAVAEGGRVDRDDGRLRSHAQGSLPETGGESGEASATRTPFRGVVSGR